MATKELNLRPELLDELLNGAKTQDEIFGPNGVIKRLTGALVERALKAEMAYHLTESRPADEAGNRRNGSSRKTLHTEHGPVPIEVPRDRHSTFEPIIVPKHATRVAGLDEKILALNARGMSTRDIQAELSALYGTEVSPTLISQVTDAVHDEIRASQSRPVESVYTVL